MDTVTNDLRRDGTSADIFEEGSEVAGGCKPRYVQARHAGLEILIESGEAAHSFESRQDCGLGKIRDLPHIHLITDGEDDVVHVCVSPPGKTHVQSSIGKDFAGLDTRVGDERDVRLADTRCEPGLQFQAVIMTRWREKLQFKTA